MNKRVIVIGGGAAGMQAALRLKESGVEPTIVEREAETGGKLRDWYVLFPSFTPAADVLGELRRRVAERHIEVMTSTGVKSFTSREVTLDDGRRLACDAVVLATGFTLFDASLKEEYGYGLYDNVFTSGVVCEVAPLCGACCGMSCYTTAAHTYGALAVAYYCGGRDAASVAME